MAWQRHFTNVNQSYRSHGTLRILCSGSRWGNHVDGAHAKAGSVARSDPARGHIRELEDAVKERVGQTKVFLRWRDSRPHRRLCFAPQAHFRIKDPRDPSFKKWLTPSQSRALLRRADATPKVLAVKREIRELLLLQPRGVALDAFCFQLRLMIREREAKLTGDPYTRKGYTDITRDHSQKPDRAMLKIIAAMGFETIRDFLEAKMPEVRIEMVSLQDGAPLRECAVLDLNYGTQEQADKPPFNKTAPRTHLKKGYPGEVNITQKTNKANPPKDKFRPNRVQRLKMTHETHADRKRKRDKIKAEEDLVKHKALLQRAIQNRDERLARMKAWRKSLADAGIPYDAPTEVRKRFEEATTPPREIGEWHRQ